MPSPFPGMDPYLEDSANWSGFHQYLSTQLVAYLMPLIGPKYYADVEVQTVAEEVAITASHTYRLDVGVLERGSARTQPVRASGAATGIATAAPVQPVVIVPGQTKLRTVQIHLTETRELVTSIEILSPVNKRPGKGLVDYRSKRDQLLQSAVHLIELDLLWGGQRPGLEVQDPPLDTDYVVLVNRASSNIQRISEIWPVALNEPLPVIPVPLLYPDPDAVLDLNRVLQTVYDQARYDWRIDYRQPVPPLPLRPAMAAWLREHLPQVGVAAS